VSRRHEARMAALNPSSGQTSHSRFWFNRDRPPSARNTRNVRFRGAAEAVRMTDTGARRTCAGACLTSFSSTKLRRALSLLWLLIEPSDTPPINRGSCFLRPVGRFCQGITSHDDARD
jgi:hypothetical protein